MCPNPRLVAGDEMTNGSGDAVLTSLHAVTAAVAAAV